MLLGSMCEWASHSPNTAPLVRHFRRPGCHTGRPLLARPRRVAQERNASPITVGVCIHAVLPIMRSTDWAPLRLEFVSNEFLRRIRLLLLQKMRHEEFLPRVCEGAVPAARAPFCLMAQTLPVKVRVVEQFRCAVTHLTTAAIGAWTVVVELLAARLCRIGQCAFACLHDKTSTVTLAVKKGAAPMVVRRLRSLQRTWYCFELPQHPLDLNLGRVVSGLLSRQVASATTPVRNGTERRHRRRCD